MKERHLLVLVITYLLWCWNCGALWPFVHTAPLQIFLLTYLYGITQCYAPSDTWNMSQWKS